MRKYFILIGILTLMTANLFAQYPPIMQGNIIEGSDLTFDAIVYCHFTITKLYDPDTVNFAIHLAPVDTIRAYGDYSVQLRYRSRAGYNANYFDARNQGGPGNYTVIDTVRIDTNAASVGYHCWLSVHLVGGASTYDAFLMADGATEIDTIAIGANFRNQPNPAFLRIWSLISYENRNPQLNCTNVGLVDNLGDIITSVKDVNLSPAKFSLSQSFPNPFNPETRIQFSLPEKGYVRLNVYNMLGQLVAVLVNEELSAGTKEVVWNSKDQNGHGVTSGVYFYRLETPQGAITKKMTLVK